MKIEKLFTQPKRVSIPTAMNDPIQGILEKNPKEPPNELNPQV